MKMEIILGTEQNARRVFYDHFSRNIQPNEANPKATPLGARTSHHRRMGTCAFRVF
jgi:hypothetical protein